MSKDERPNNVGYGKPPKNCQFTKGKSGNPKGRPKGSKNLASIVLRESRQRVRVNGPGGSRTVKHRSSPFSASFSPSIPYFRAVLT